MEKDRLRFLDNLRGIAALYVLVHHVLLSPQPNLLVPDYLAPAIHFGAAGVWLFFVISAFSLSLTMPRHIATGTPLLSFSISRLFRIAPLFYALVLFHLIRDYALLGATKPVEGIAANLLFIFNLFPEYTKSIVWGGWAIGPEMLFYALFPLIYFKVKRLEHLVILLFASVAIYAAFQTYGSALFSSRRAFETFNSRTLIRHFPSFILGMIAFQLYMTLKDHTSKKLLGRLIFAASFISIVAFWYGHPPLPLLHNSHMDAFAFAGLLLGAGLARPRLMETSLMSYYGKISFSVYLWHIQVIFHLTPFLRWFYTLGLPAGISFLCSVAVVLAVTTLVAHYSYKLIERPGEKLGKAVFALLKRDRHSVELSTT
jgi:peptidoglycan/LPS O-acetylase OafA/YrhL